MKNDLVDNGIFTRVDLRRVGNDKFDVEERVAEIYQEMMPIQKAKKDDLIDMLRFVRPEVKDFHINLKSKNELGEKNFDPDLDKEEDVTNLERNEHDNSGKEKLRIPLPTTEKEKSKKSELARVALKIFQKKSNENINPKRKIENSGSSEEIPVQRSRRIASKPQTSYFNFFM